MNKDGTCEICGYCEEDRSLHIHQLHERLRMLGKIHSAATVIYLRYKNGFPIDKHILHLGGLLDEAKPEIRVK